MQTRERVEYTLVNKHAAPHKCCSHPIGTLHIRFCFSLCYLTWLSLCLRRPFSSPIASVHLCVNRITTEKTFCLRWVHRPSLDCCSAQMLHMWSFPLASSGTYMLTSLRKESSEHQILVISRSPDTAGPPVFMLTFWYILSSLLRLHNRPWLISRQQVYELVLIWTFGWMHSLIQRRCVASLSFSPSLSAQRSLASLRCLPPAHSMSAREIWDATVSGLDLRQVRIWERIVIRNAQQRKSGRSCRRIAEGGSQSKRRRHMLTHTNVA